MLSTKDLVEALQAETKGSEKVEPSSIQSLSNENTDTKREEEKKRRIANSATDMWEREALVSRT